MNTPSAFSWLSVPAWLPLIYALLHTLWHGLLAAGALFLVLRFVPARRAGLRYGLSAAALTMVVLAGVGTWALIDAPPRSPTGTINRQPLAVAASGRLPEGSFPTVSVALPTLTSEGLPMRIVSSLPIVPKADDSSAKRWVRWAAAAWLLGVAVSLLRAVSGMLGAGRLRRRCRELVEPQVLALAEQLRARLGVSRRVRFLVCDKIGVPSMLGVLYPAVLLPASLLTGVPMEQLRAILAHELAHIRRWDYLVNLAQMLVEALLFFNPFVWWISRQVRLEREACCDQVAAAECGSPACYVEALVAVIERGRATAAAPMLAASGPGPHGGSTLDRARRLLVPSYQPALRLRWFSLATVLVLAGSTLGGLWWGTHALAQTVRAGEEKTTSKPADGPQAVPGMPDDALAAARKGNAEQVLSLLKASRKTSNFYEENPAPILDGLIHARELRAFTTLYDALQHFSAKNWKPDDDGLVGLVKEGRTDFLDALIARRLNLDRLTKAAASADPATAAWVTRRVAEATKQRAGIEALEKAAGNNDLPTLGRLVDDGIDVNGVGQDDNTPLLRAVFKDHLEAAQWLLDHGAQVDKTRIPDGANYTPLSLVESVPMAELLKKNGANIHAKLFGGNESILVYAVEQAKADVVAWFLKQGLDANAIGANDENLLFNLKDGATAEVLLAAGADPNHVDEFGFRPLTSAHSAEVVRALVRHGANVKPEPRNGKTLLELAVSHMDREDDTPEEEAGYIEELLKQGAEFDPKVNGIRAMLSAAEYDHVGEVRVFLDHGVSPNASYEGGPFAYGSALSAAALRGSGTLKLLLARGADPNAPVPTGRWGPLENALAMGAFDSVELLRQAGAKGLSDLFYASARGDAAKVGELLDRHADPNEVSPAGWTPLLYTVQRGQVQVAKQLLDHGASVDAFDTWGFSPSLYLALYQKASGEGFRSMETQWHLPLPEVQARMAALQELFAQHPPDPAYRSAAGRTALHQAAWSGSFVALGLLLEGNPRRSDPNAPDQEGRTPLLLAAQSPAAREARGIFAVGAHVRQQQDSQARMTADLLKAGARLDLVVADGKTVGELALAAAHDANNAKLVAVLTDAMHAQPNPESVLPAPTPVISAPAASPDKIAVSASQPRDLANLEPDQLDTIYSALRVAIQAGDLQTVDGFLRRGLEVNAVPGDDPSLLFLATDANQLAIVKLLLAHGADFLQKTSWGDVPLQRACWRGYREIADALIQAGAPKDELSYATGMGDVPALEARDQRQLITPPEARGKLFFAVASGHPDTFDFLWKKLGPMDDPNKSKILGDLYENVGKWGHANMLPVLEALGASPAKDGPHALGQAVAWNHPEAAKALLERGVLADPPSQYGMLRNAAGEGHLEIVSLLLDHGADINALDGQGLTPLSWAAYGGKEDVCLLLLERGADGRIKDRDGRNAAWHAAAGPHCAVALDWMIKAGVPVKDKDQQGETILDHLMNFSTPGSTLHGEFFSKVYSPTDLARFDESERRVVESLLAAGVEPSECKHGLLAEAMYSEHYVAARVLLAHGADPALKDQNGSNALFSLVQYAPDGPLPMDLFKTLLQRDSRPNPEEADTDATPATHATLLDYLISWASRNPRRTASFGEAVKIMLDGGATFAGAADTNAQALLQGAARGNLTAIEQSIRQGALVSFASDQGWDALTIATALGYDDCVDWLLDHGADANGHHPDAENSPLIFAVQRGRTELVDRLLGKGAKIADSYDALFWAVNQKNARILDALLRSGADPKAVPHETEIFNGKTVTPQSALALYLCVEKGLTDMARMLLDKGANADPPDLSEGRNLAYWAVSYDQPEILRLLLDHGADPLLKDESGDSALDKARKFRPKLVPMLEEAAKRRPAPSN